MALLLLVMFIGVKIKKGHLVNYYKSFAVSDDVIICRVLVKRQGMYSKCGDHFNYYYIKNKQLRG